MPLPNKIRIFGRTYSIEYTDHYTNVDKSKEYSLNGQIRYKEQEISIQSKDRPIEGQFEILLHEILHAVCTYTHVEFKEEDIERISNGLFATLHDNGFLLLEEKGKKSHVNRK